MGKKGKTARLKRKPAPAFWPIHRKELPWVSKALVRFTFTREMSAFNVGSKGYPRCSTNT